MIGIHDNLKSNWYNTMRFVFIFLAFFTLSCSPAQETEKQTTDHVKQNQTHVEGLRASELAVLDSLAETEGKFGNWGISKSREGDFFITEKINHEQTVILFSSSGEFKHESCSHIYPGYEQTVGCPHLRTQDSKLPVNPYRFIDELRAFINQ